MNAKQLPHLCITPSPSVATLLEFLAEGTPIPELNFVFLHNHLIHDSEKFPKTHESTQDVQDGVVSSNSSVALEDTTGQTECRSCQTCTASNSDTTLPYLKCYECHYTICRKALCPQDSVPQYGFLSQCATVCPDSASTTPAEILSVHSV